MARKNRLRPEELTVYVTADEKDRIYSKMEAAKISNMSTYLRKMALDGYVLNVNISEISDAVKLLRYSSNNINQIARHANETGSIYKSDIEDIKLNYEKLWDSMKDILKQLNELMTI